MLTPRPGREGRGLALLGSLCLFLSAIEYLIPKPLPFMRLGLANLPLLLSLDVFGAADFFLLALLKVLGQGIIGGTLFSYVFLFSFAGTFASAALMYILRMVFGKKRVGFAGLGCAGAMASNGVQLVLARFFVFGPALRYLMPPFLASGFITGIALGLLCEYFCRRSLWYEKHSRYAQYTPLARNAANPQCAGGGGRLPACVSQDRGPQDGGPQASSGEERRLRRGRRWNELFNADELFVAGLLMAFFFLFNRSLECRVIHFLFFCLLAWLSGKKNNVFVTVLVMAGIVFFNLLAPYGKVLTIGASAFGGAATFGGAGWLRITQGSLLSGLDKALTLTGLLMLSRACGGSACVKSNLKLPGFVGSLLGESFRLLELMRDRVKLINRKNIAAEIDAMLLEMDAAHTGDQEDTSKPKRSIKNILLLSSMAAFTAAVFAICRLSIL
jgi:heptaprenyl diphosphate synthase